MADLWEQAAQEYKASGKPLSPTEAGGEDWKIWNAAPDTAEESKTLNPWKHPLTDGLIGQGVQQVVGGVKHMMQPGKEAKYAGASEVLGGAGKALAPVAIGAAIPAAVAAPFATAGAAAIGAAGSLAGGLIGRFGSQAVGASPEGQQLSEDVGGLIGGAGGGYAGSKLPGLFKVDPHVAINRSLRPVPSNPDFSQRMPETLASIKAMNPGFTPAVVNGELNLAPAINRTINAHQDALEPWLARMEHTKVSGAPIVEATQKAVREMLPTEQGNAQALIDQAKKDYTDFTPRELRARLAMLNQRLASFYGQSPNRQSAALADIPEAVLKAQRDAVADTLYTHLDPENMGAGPRLIQSKTGDLIDLRDAAVRRQNAIVAEQPLTSFGKFADPIKGFVRSLMPGKATGAGIAFAEGSEGRSLPLLKRAFAGADERAGAGAYGGLPHPGPRLLSPPPDASGSLPPGVADFRSVGQHGGPWPRGGSTRQPLMLPPASSRDAGMLGTSGTTVPGGPPKFGYNPYGDPLSTPTSTPSQFPASGLLPAPPPGQAPLNVQPRGPVQTSPSLSPGGDIGQLSTGSIGPGGTVPKFSTETGTPMPGQRGGRMADLAKPAVPELNLSDVTSYAQRKGISLRQAAVELGILPQ